MGRGGARPGAGRPTKLDESQCIALTMDCLDLTHKYIHNETIPLRDRAEVFSRIASKAIPQNMKFEGDIKVSGINIKFSDGTEVKM